ncbi:MAG: hypothetical protein ACLGI3_16835 [Actinomycetes bacterium]
MATLTARQLYDLARDAGLNPTAAVVAAAVALGESGGRTDAQGDVGIQTSKWGPSVGLWQVRSLKADYGTGRTRDAKALTNPTHNARAMAEISGAGSNWRPWSVFTSGKYRDHLGTVTTAAGQPAHPRAPYEGPGGTVTNAPTYRDTVLPDAADRVITGAVDALNPFAAFANWQSDLQGVLVKLAVTGAAAWLVVAGVKSAAGGDA